MKLIILSAGKGLRLGNLTLNTPKILMDLGDGRTLLETHFQNITKSGVIDKIVIVTGYLGEQIDAKILKYKMEGTNIKTIKNPFYDFSNNLISLWLAKNEMDEDFIITNGDNLFEPRVFADLVNKNKEGIFLTISKHKIGKILDDDMKVILGEGVERVSKQIPNNEAHGESVGLALVSGDKYRRLFREILEELATDQRNINSFWLEIFNRASERGIIIKPFEINGAVDWKEIDFHGDLERLLHFLRSGRQQSLKGNQDSQPTPKEVKLDNQEVKKEGSFENEVEDILRNITRDLASSKH